jgi:hypothetical protein
MAISEDAFALLYGLREQFVRCGDLLPGDPERARDELARFAKVVEQRALYVYAPLRTWRARRSAREYGGPGLRLAWACAS